MHMETQSWQEGETVEKCFTRAEEEPPASKFYGLHTKTTSSAPVAQLMDNSYPYLGVEGTSLNFISINYSKLQF